MKATDEEVFEAAYQHYLNKGCTASEAGSAAKQLLARMKQKRKQKHG